MTQVHPMKLNPGSLVSALAKERLSFSLELKLQVHGHLVGLEGGTGIEFA